MHGVISVLLPTEWKDYTLLDSGNGSKLEQFGPYRLIRPENQALWNPSLTPDKWDQADAKLERAPKRRGEWSIKNSVPKQWIMSYNGIKFWTKITPFGHVGIFPEQATQWKWIEEKVRSSKRTIKLLNLFGYTGIASLFAARDGALVTHVDSSKPAVYWASENMNASRLESAKIRWIVDDSIKFIEREGRRGNKYDAVIMDPPKFGRGPRGEVWNFESDIRMLLSLVQTVLSSQPEFMILNAYAIPLSSITIGNLLEEMMIKYQGTTECGELVLKETSGNRFLPMSLFARWSSHSPKDAP